MSYRNLFFLCVFVSTLSACSDLRESLGLGRNAPDEFSVADRPPLAIPPDFALRPPQPGAPRPQEIDMGRRADDILFTNVLSAKPVAPNAPSDAEKALLEKTGATKADTNIRELINREDAQKIVATPHLIDEILWWKKREKPAVTVDSAAEAKRIKEAQAKGENIDKGATPVIERQKSGWLGL